MKSFPFSFVLPYETPNLMTVRMSWEARIAISEPNSLLRPATADGRTVTLLRAMVKRKASDATEMMDVSTDVRAAQLRARVEALARVPGDAATLLHEGWGGHDPSEGVQEGCGKPDGRGGRIPMLIRSTDTGVYLKWSLMLQDQLARMKTAYDALKSENEDLRRQLRLPAGSPSHDADGPPTQVTSPRDTSPPAKSASSPDSTTKRPSEESKHHPEVVEPTPRQADLAKQADLYTARSDASDLGSGAAALILLASPKPSPLGCSPSTRDSAAPAPGMLLPLPAMASSCGAWTCEARPSAPMSMMPPRPASSSWSAGVPPRSFAQMLGPSAAAQPALAHPSADSIGSMSGLGVGNPGEQDELLAELLSSPNLLNSPSLSMNIRAYLEGKGGSLGASPLGASPRMAAHPLALGAGVPAHASIHLPSLASFNPLSDQNASGQSNMIFPRVGGVTPVAAPVFRRVAGNAWPGLAAPKL